VTFSGKGEKKGLNRCSISQRWKEFQGQKWGDRDFRGRLPCQKGKPHHGVSEERGKYGREKSKNGWQEGRTSYLEKKETQPFSSFGLEKKKARMRPDGRAALVHAGEEGTLLR